MSIKYKMCQKGGAINKAHKLTVHGSGRNTSLLNFRVKGMHLCSDHGLLMPIVYMQKGEQAERDERHGTAM